MDVNVLQNIDLFPTTNRKTIDSFIDNSSSYLRQLSSISFWDSADNVAPSTVTDTKVGPGSQIPTGDISTVATSTTNNKNTASTNITQDASNSTSKSGRLAKSGLKRKRTIADGNGNGVRPRKNSSELDCCDYWLRFDSDDDSLDNLGDYENYGSPTRRRQLYSPAFGTGCVGQVGNPKMDLTSRVDDWDDSALDHALSEEEDSFSMGLEDEFARKDAAQSPVVAPERLYSTPLSWEAPQPALRVDSYFNNSNSSMNGAERQRLLAIAMGSGLAPTPNTTRAAPWTDYNFDQSPTTPSDSASTQLDTMIKQSHSKPQSRAESFSSQTRPNTASEKPKEKPRNSERAAHNDIERKYRTNLKDRIAELREAVPSLRTVPEDHDDDGSPVPLTSTPKVSKGTVLTKATEYIHQLERRNRSMAHKNDELLRRLQAFEQLLGANPAPSWQPQGYGAAVFNQNRFPS